MKNSNKVLFIILGIIIFIIGIIILGFVKQSGLFKFNSIYDAILEILGFIICCIGGELIWFAIKNSKNKK